MGEMGPSFEPGMAIRITYGKNVRSFSLPGEIISSFNFIVSFKEKGISNFQ